MKLLLIALLTGCASLLAITGAEPIPSEVYNIGTTIIVTNQDSVWFWGTDQRAGNGTGTVDQESAYYTKEDIVERIELHVTQTEARIATLEIEKSEAEAVKAIAEAAIWP